MNSKRAMNRRRSMSGGSLKIGSSRMGRRPGGVTDTTEPEHHERGYVGHRNMDDHKSNDSKASVGAMKGPGPKAGAGENDGPWSGPGRASNRKMGMPEDMYPSGKTPPGSNPKGLSTMEEGGNASIYNDRRSRT